MRCSQIINGAPCGLDAVGRYTWPGSDEAGICGIHRRKLEAVAEALGFHLQIVPLEDRGGETPEQQKARHYDPTTRKSTR